MYMVYMVKNVSHPDSDLDQECGEACHPDVVALAGRSGKNDIRDFWRYADVPIASWY